MTPVQVATLLKGWDQVLILTHKRPDGDTIGCAVALCHTLRALGKTAWLLPNEDATTVFDPYLKSVLAPGDFVPRHVLAVDIASEGLFPQSALPYKGKVELCIDHHPSNEGYALQSCVEPDKAACGEILYQICTLLLGSDSPLPQTVALPLYVAVSTDTGCFQFANTTANTHLVAARLMETGIDAAQVNKRHFRTKSVARMKLESLIIEHMHLYHQGTVAVAPISLELMAQAGATSEDTDDIAAFLGQLKGVLHTATIREHEGGECRISLRTQAELLNATKVCARLGGGGHRAASGCTVQGTVDEAERAILAAIDDQLAQPTQD